MDSHQAAIHLPSTISAAEFAARFKSKRECYRFLTVEVDCYLPPLANTTIYHMKDLISGAKNVSPPFPNTSPPVDGASQGDPPRHHTLLREPLHRGDPQVREAVRGRPALPPHREGPQAIGAK